MKCIQSVQTSKKMSGWFYFKVFQSKTVSNCFLEKHIIGFILTDHIHLAKFDLIFEENILNMDEWIHGLLIIVKYSST